MLNPKPIPLNSGLDTVTPAIMQEGGALQACMNYEMTGTFGYRRIDGFERYDGWVNGDIATYYRVPVTITDGAVVATLVPGAPLTTVDLASATPIVIGVVIAYAAGQLTYVSFNPDYVVVPNATGLDTDYNTTTRMTSTATAVNGMTADTPATFVANLRAYSATLRAAVVAMPSNVAGLYWFRNTAVAAIDAPKLTYVDPTNNAAAVEGGLVGYGGATYRIINKAYSSGTATVTLYLEPFTTNAFAPANVVLVGNTGSLVVATSATLVTTSSDWAYLVALYNPETGAARGRRTLKRSYILAFLNAGTAAQADFVSGGLVAVGTAGSTYNNAYVNNVVLTSGTYAAGTATGYIEVILDSNLGFNGDTNYITTTQDILSFGGGTKYADITYVSLSKIAGTKRLRSRNTRYVWDTYNFYGQEDTTRFYGATGASRAFWGNAYINPLTMPAPAGATAADETVIYAWGNILTDLVFPDKPVYPKYLAFHGTSQLALGLWGGSVLLSVVGEPLNYSGLLGAQEVATGGDVTGLLEGVGDSTIVFSDRAIRRLSGSTDADLALETISGNAGALEYTAVLVGSTPVFTNNSGITSLEQTESYGDFQGLRSSYKVSNTLPVELVSDRSDSETGGAAMAMVVRSKDQYRLFLKSGKIVTVTFTGDGSKIMESNYGVNYTGVSDIRVPFAWSSAITDGGKEIILVSWDDYLARRMENVTGTQGTSIPDPTRIYALDRGWGFDGIRFPHNFDISHIFERAGTRNLTVAKIRAYGKGYGLASLNIKAVGIEGDFDAAYHNRIQDISLTRNLEQITPSMRNVTNIVDSANRGLGIKIGIYGTELTPTQTEPSHIIQVLVCDIAEGGQLDG